MKPDGQRYVAISASYEAHTVIFFTSPNSVQILGERPSDPSLLGRDRSTIDHSALLCCSA